MELGKQDADDFTLLRNVRDRLSALADVAERAAAAIAVNDEEKTRVLVSDMRRARSALGTAEARASGSRAPSTAEGVGLLVELRELFDRAQTAQNSVLQWIQRPRGAESDLLQSAEGVRRLADSLLPFLWDLEFDLLLIVGAGSAQLVTEIMHRGQKRVIVYSSEDPKIFPANAHVISDHESARKMLLELHNPPPTQMAWKHLPDDAITSEDREGLVKTIRGTAEELLANMFTAQLLGEAWVTQGIMNLPHVAANPSIAALKGAFQGKPAVVIAPGLRSTRIFIF